MASISNLTTPTRFLPLSNSIKDSSNQSKSYSYSYSYSNSKDFSCSSLQISRKSVKRKKVVIRSVKEEASEVIGIEKLNEIATQIQREKEKEREFEVEVVGSVSSSSDGKIVEEKSEFQGFVDRTINATIVLAAGTFAITRLLTIDHDYWQGWTFYEILRYAPEHNWIAYEEALKSNPVLAKMAISGIVYSLGDWIAQCVEGKPLFEFDRTRAFRSGLVGFTLHGSLSHYYYQFCEALIPYKDWWVVPAKVAFDQTVWSAVWNSIYFVVLGLLRFESPANIYGELKETFRPMLTAGWKLWPFAHIITYGVIPLEQRLLWVDCVELIWVTILSTYSNEKSEERISEATPDSSSTTSPEK